MGIKIELKKKEFALKYKRFFNLKNQYDCGMSLFLEMNSEASKLKREMDEIWKNLQENDPGCPKCHWTGL